MTLASSSSAPAIVGSVVGRVRRQCFVGDLPKEKKDLDSQREEEERKRKESLRNEIDNCYMSTEDMLLMHSPWASRFRTTPQQREKFSKARNTNQRNFASFKEFGVWAGDSTSETTRQLALRRRQRWTTKCKSIGKAAVAAMGAWISATAAMDRAQQAAASLAPPPQSNQLEQSGVGVGITVDQDKLLKFLQRRHKPEPIEPQDRTVVGSNLIRYAIVSHPYECVCWSCCNTEQLKSAAIKNAAKGPIFQTSGTKGKKKATKKGKGKKGTKKGTKKKKKKK
jgi:hypothetical protein